MRKSRSEYNKTYVDKKSKLGLCRSCPRKKRSDASICDVCTEIERIRAKCRNGSPAEKQHAKILIRLVKEAAGEVVNRCKCGARVNGIGRNCKYCSKTHPIRRYRLGRENGTTPCLVCAGSAVSGSLCNKCKNHRNAYQNNRAQKRKSAGLCRECPSKSRDGKILCEPCAKKNSERKKAMRRNQNKSDSMAKSRSKA